MSIPKYSELCELVHGLKEVLEHAQDHVTVNFYVRDHNDTDEKLEPRYVMPASELRKILEECTYNEDYPGWLVRFPGEFIPDDGYYGIYHSDWDEFYSVKVEPDDYQI